MSPSPTRSSTHPRLASVLLSFGKGTNPSRVDGLPPGFDLVSSGDGRNHVAFRFRTPFPGEPPQRRSAFPGWLVLGDDCELENGAMDEPTGNGTTLHVDLDGGTLEATTSIPGLPALYVTETDGAVVVTSDPHLLTHVRGLALRFDPVGVRELAAIGRPVGYRTLFAGVDLVPGGARLTVRHGRAETRAVWSAPERDPLRSWDEYTALQAEAFGRQMALLDLRSCELSLSSGLDSRATLAGVISTGATVSALTVSGETQCLDARSAERVCKAYGFRHQTIRLGDDFRRSLPDLVTTASLLSGGISSMWHAAQVYCYRVLGDPGPVNALSGYLGNQIGRRGTEGLTPRDAETDLLCAELRAGEPIDGRAWYRDHIQDDGFIETQFLIQQESTLGNLASYQVGNSHSIQQSAYACRPLIENMWRLPVSEPDPGGSSAVQNLKHLFLGEPLEESFQRRFINGVGGVVSTYPINWGWRSRGGVSIPGVWRGGLTLVDAIVSSRFPESALARATKLLGIAGLHEFRPVHEWMHRHMKEFVYDELLSSTALRAGVFDEAALRAAVDGYYDEGRGFRQIVLALDLALAAKGFGATL